MLLFDFFSRDAYLPGGGALYDGRTFCQKTFCRADFLPKRHLVERTTCRK